MTDIDSIRAFAISTGSPLSAFGVPGARFLNDLAISADGVLYASDSGLKQGLPATLSTSWDAKAVYLVDLKAGRSRPLFANMEAPADIGYDTKRHRLLIPLVTSNRLEIRRAP